MNHSPRSTSSSFGELTPAHEPRRPSIAQRAAASVVEAGLKTVAIIGITGSLIGGALGTTGMRMWGPKDDIAVVTKEGISRDSARQQEIKALGSRMTATEMTVGEVKDILKDIKGDIRVLTMVACATAKAQHSSLEPDTCAKPSDQRRSP